MDSVKVALRIRPLVKNELDNGCQSCIERVPNEPQVGIGKANQMFTFNYVFDEFEGQSKIYNDAVKHLIDNLFKGYNVTILAYGQTGSGKTFTMGTNYSGDGEMGVIPRAVYDIFEVIDKTEGNTFKVTVSFIELYNESLYDLLTNKSREQSIVDMREHNNSLVMPGLTAVEVTSPEETLEKLKEGSLGRMVGATAMNAQSSRSHAIFTVNIRITPNDNPKETIMSKFHLVDLAGSERSKKTGATGERFREGVNINKGLLVLGNVISQLGEGNNSFINYRDSKLTRLLQDSLGGNSVTLMIACISPADYNQDESLSTLRYADRAKKIKNKPIVNQDPCVAELNRLRKENEELRLKIIEGGVTTFDCPPSHKVLEKAVQEKEKSIKELQKDLVEALSANSRNYERNLLEEKMQTALNEKLSQLIDVCEKPDGDTSALLNEIKSMIFEVKAEYIRNEQELIAFEKQNHLNSKSSEENGMDQDEDDEDDEISLPVKREHVASQSQINEQILKLTKSLAMKEDLMSKLCESSSYLNNMNNSSEENVNEMKQKMAHLQREREELRNQLKQMALDKTNSSKIAEQGKKREAELEQTISVLKKKIDEYDRLKKMKYSADEKIAGLKSEIDGMKQLKVRLVKQMKSDSEKFRQWKVQRDRELHSLKNQNVKNQNQIKKMELMHTLQKNVLKRKLEAAAAANKRIMTVLERQKSCRGKKPKQSVFEQLKDRVHEELELIESAYQAEKSLECLIQDRADFKRDLGALNEKLKDVSLSQEERIDLKSDKEKLEHEVALRSAEVADLQQKLSDIKDELKKNNWEMLETIPDAKQALIFVFNLLTEKCKENLNKANIIADFEVEKNELSEEVKKYKKKLDDLIDFHQRKVESIERESEEKMIELLKHFDPRQQEKSPELQNSLISKQNEIIENLNKRISQQEELIAGKINPANTKVSTYEDAFHRFINECNSQTQAEDSKFILARKSRLTGDFKQIKCKEDNYDKENCYCSVTLNKTFTKEDLDQDDIDSLNELAPPKRMRTETSSNSNERSVFKPLNTFCNPNL